MATTRPTDLDIMMLADGELEPARAREVAAAVERDPALKTKLAALGQVGEAVRTYLELETDHAEADIPEFADMWAHIDQKVRANGQDVVHREEVAPPTSPSRRPAAESAGVPIWARTRNFLSGHRGHLLSGLISAGAVAALMIGIGRPARIVERPSVAVGPGGPVGRSNPATPVSNPLPCVPTPGSPRLAPAAPPEVEDFEVYDGTGMVFTLPGEGDGDSSAAVIWINKDQDTVEGPI